jgi:Reverse transcriptase (RNA-dependent DNA polymerase)
VLHEIIYNRPKKTKNSINSLKVDDSISTDHAVIAESFNDFFIDIPIILDRQIPTIHRTQPHSNNSLIKLSSFEPVTNDEILKIIDELKMGVACDYDGISCRFVKLIKDEIKDLLSRSGNEMFRSCVFPETLKIAQTVPIYKDGDKLLPTNYRPVSVLSIFAKIFEIIIKKRIDVFLIRNRVIHESQFGFLKHSNTSSATINLMTGIVGHLESKQKTGCVFVVEEGI